MVKEAEKKNIEFPLFIEYKNKFYAVKGYLEDYELGQHVSGKCYVRRSDNSVWVFSRKKKLVGVPYFRIENVYDDKSEEMIWEYRYYDVEDKDVKKRFTLNNLVDISYEYILENSNENDVLYNEEVLSDLNSATSVYKPTIEDDDDPLKQIIKLAILNKGIDINRLKYKLKNKYTITNMRSALANKTKMSISNFNLWCELLGLTYKIEMCDDGTDTINPLKEMIVYDSNNGLSK